ncbi:MAG: hypothetical protein JWO36_5543 [Myxococcales bacterium]|nr:hypothetical protein [Myxococcales bacterium]
MRIISSLMVVLAGCSTSHTDIAATMRFSDRSDAEIARMIGAAGGNDMFGAEARVNSVADPITPDPCPAIAISGNTGTLTGGCTTHDGIEIQGSAIVTNPIGWTQIDPQYGADTVYELHQLAFAQSGYTQSFDGSFRITDSFSTYDANLTATQLGMSVRSQLYYHCDAGNSTCNLEGSGVELIGIGGAQVSGTFYVNNSGTADFTLVGADTLTAHVAQGCVSWQISGSGRAKTCP